MLFGTLYFLEYNLLTIMAQTINGWYSELYFAIYERFQNMLTRKVKGKKGRKGNYRLFNWYNDGNSNKRGKNKKGTKLWKKGTKNHRDCRNENAMMGDERTSQDCNQIGEKKGLESLFYMFNFLFNWYIYILLCHSLCVVGGTIN